jgi:hypothetical protein
MRQINEPPVFLWSGIFFGGEEALPDYKVTFDRDRLKAAAP